MSGHFGERDKFKFRRWTVVSNLVYFLDLKRKVLSVCLLVAGEQIVLSSAEGEGTIPCPCMSQTHKYINNGYFL